MSISSLQALIDKANKRIEVIVNTEIPTRERKIEICKTLKTTLGEMNTASSSGAKVLSNAADKLNAGLKISGQGQGYKIKERCEVITKLTNDIVKAKSMVETRQGELEIEKENLEIEKSELESSIAAWQAEIDRILIEEARKEAEEKMRKYLNGGF